MPYSENDSISFPENVSIQLATQALFSGISSIQLMTQAASVTFDSNQTEHHSIRINSRINSELYPSLFFIRGMHIRKVPAQEKLLESCINTSEARRYVQCSPPILKPPGTCPTLFNSHFSALKKWQS